MLKIKEGLSQIPKYPSIIIWYSLNSSQSWKIQSGKFILNYFLSSTIWILVIVTDDIGELYNFQRITDLNITLEYVTSFCIHDLFKIWNWKWYKKDYWNGHTNKMLTSATFNGFLKQMIFLFSNASNQKWTSE